MNAREPQLFEPDVATAEPTTDLVLHATTAHPEDDDWRWWNDDENAENIVVQEQRATAVYVANRGDICIRQPNTDIDQDDVCVFIRPEHVQGLIRKLQELIR